MIEREWQKCKFEKKNLRGCTRGEMGNALVNLGRAILMIDDSVALLCVTVWCIAGGPVGIQH